MDDVQPNERRLSRKGSTAIPRVRSTRPVHFHRPRRQPPHGTHEQAPGRDTLKRWTEKHDRHLRANRRGALPHPVDPYRSSVRINRQSAMVQFSIKAGDIAQDIEPGPSLTSWIGGSSRYIANRSPIPSSEHSVQRELVRPSTPEMKSHLQIMHTTPRRRPPMDTATPKECVADLTSCPPSLLARENPVRWSTFRSGHMRVPLLPSNGDLRVSPLGSNTVPRSSIPQELPHAIGQRRDLPVECDSSSKSHLPQPSIHTNDMLPGHHEKGRGYLSDQLHQNDLEMASSSRSADRPAILEEEAETLPESPHHSPLFRGLAFACGKLPLSLGSHDRPRRVLHDDNSAYVVTAHGVIDQVCATGVLKLARNIRSPPLALEEFVDDACLLSHQGEPTIILAHARQQNQVTILNLGYDQTPRHIRLDHGRNTVKRGGASAVASMFPLKFATGSYSHRVHLWDVAQDLSGASAVELAIRHASVIHSLLFTVDTSHKLVSVGADRDVSIYDMSAERVAYTLKTSCTPFHAHKTRFPSCILLEVGHLETQFEVRDYRLSHRAVQRFGFTTEERRGRFEKGDTWSHFAVCGDRKGVVHVWDLRNVSAEVVLQQCFDVPVMHVANTGPRLLACSKRNELACINLPAGE